MSYITNNTINEMKGKNLLFLKIETSGLPVSKKNMPPEETYHKAKYNCHYDNSRIIQIAWVYTKFNDDFDISSVELKEAVRKANIKLTKESIAIHGISDDDIKKGTKLKKLLDGDLGKSIRECDYIVAYNAFFDVSILRNEIFRLKIVDIGKKMVKLVKDKKIICIGQLARIHIMKNWTPIYKYQIPPQVTAYEECMGDKPEFMKKHMAGSSLLNSLEIFEKIVTL